MYQMQNNKKRNMKYGDYGDKSDQFLAKRHNIIVEKLEGEVEDKEELYELMEIERELTLRENQ